MVTRKRTTARRIAGTEPLNTSFSEDAGHSTEEEGRVGACTAVKGDPGYDYSTSHAKDEAAEDIRKRLVPHVGNLRFITGVLGVCVQALNHQAADMDPEIAHLLQRVVGDELDKATDSLEAIALGFQPEQV